MVRLGQQVEILEYSCTADKVRLLWYFSRSCSTGGQANTSCTCGILFQTFQEELYNGTNWTNSTLSNASNSSKLTYTGAGGTANCNSWNV